MIIRENILEAIKAIRSNLLRTALTVSIIAIGITSLVGILTALDGLENSISSGLSSLGANTFTIKSKEQNRRRRHGRKRRVSPPMKFKEAKLFRERYDLGKHVSITTSVSGSAEIKYQGNKTNPTTVVQGIDQSYIYVEDLKIDEGRNFSSIETQRGTNVIIIGDEIKETLFENQSAMGKSITLMGKQYKIIGVLEKSEGMNEGRINRTVMIPLENAVKFSTRKVLSYNTIVSVDNPGEMEYAISEATAMMRVIRKDRIGKDDSFQIDKNETLGEQLSEISTFVRLGAFLVGFITLLGASVGLMNIMTVSVTERTREIGVRKALGAKPSLIRMQFLTEAIVICLIGGIIGVLIGIGIGNLVTVFIGSGDFIVPWFWIGTALLISVIVGIVSGYYPAQKASKLDPIESLRYE